MLRYRSDAERDYVLNHAWTLHDDLRIRLEAALLSEYANRIFAARTSGDLALVAGERWQRYE